MGTWAAKCLHIRARQEQGTLESQASHDRDAEAAQDELAVDSDPPGKITPASLEFIKASGTHGDIPPELGIVNYRLHAKKPKTAGIPGLGATAT